jgi:hypothetical protein
MERYWKYFPPGGGLDSGWALLEGSPRNYCVAWIWDTGRMQISPGSATAFTKVPTPRRSMSLDEKKRYLEVLVRMA